MSANEKVAAQQQQSVTAPLGTGTPASINEPEGSTIGSLNPGTPGIPPPTGGIEPPVLTSIDPESLPLQPPEITEFNFEVHGAGFDPTCVIVFDDEDLATEFISPTKLEAKAPVSQTAKVVDVEVARGDDLSDVITFEFVDAQAGTASKKAAARKPSKGKRPAGKAKKGR